MDVAYTIKNAAEIVGVPVTTLRAWERRYGIAVPQRTESGYRLYDDDAVRALTFMQSLVSQGWAPRQAAEETRRRLESAAPGTEVGGDDVTPAPDAPAREPSHEPSQGPSQEHSHEHEELLRAAEGLDVAAVSRLLDARYAAASFETVTDEWLLPAMTQLGLAWASGRVTVAGEHMVAHAVVRKLSGAYEATGTGGIGPRVVIGLPPKSRHEIGLLAFAVAARRAGLATTYVGADLPVDDWVAAVEKQGAVAVVLAASMDRDLDHLSRVVDVLTAARPDLVIAVGGGLQERTPGTCVRLGHRVGDAAQALAQRLA